MSREDRGAATLLVVATAAVLLFVGVALAGVAAIVRTHRTAQAAADLTALAAAATASSGGPVCARAAEVARANGGELVGCEPTGSQVVVAVRVAGPRLVGRRFAAVARARAGPG